jgi:glycosyltransferase involved in cell wall biosynthesis
MPTHPKHFMTQQGVQDTISPLPTYTLVVQGRFHAFALAKALLAKGMPLRLLTNYPAFIAEKFGLPRSALACSGHLGLVHRYAYRWNLAKNGNALDRWLHQSFSRWAGRQVLRDLPEVLHTFSGVAKELYDALERAGQNPIKILARGSAHIKEQHRDLAREAKRAHYPEIDRPSPWMVQREVEEYRRSDHIIALSSYARDGFLRRGYESDKILLLSLGSNIQQFRPDRTVIDERISRLRGNRKLQVLYTGNVSLQKGILDLLKVAKETGDQFHFKVVGNITPDAAAIVANHQVGIEYVPRVPESDLPGIYAKADAFVFPTLHDGFAAVLAQAQAGCLPIVATDHCAAPDLIQEGATGFIVPTRRPDLIIEKLRSLDENREQAIQMIENLWASQTTRDWSDVATDFIKLAALTVQQRRDKPAAGIL